VSEVVVKTAFEVWDDIRFENQIYGHGPGGLAIVPEHVATPLLHNGGYRKATVEDLQAEIQLLEQRAARLREHLEQSS
jgi:hypothetical protein